MTIRDRLNGGAPAPLHLIGPAPMTRQKRKPSKVTQQASPPRRKSRHDPRHDSRHDLQRAAESRTAVAATVAWMLALVATVLAEVLGLACQLYSVLVEASDLMRVLAAVMLYVACLAGLVTLVMIPIVLHVAQHPPPRVILRVAAVAGSLPWMVIVLEQILR